MPKSDLRGEGYLLMEICQLVIGRGNGREVILTGLLGRRARWICWVESLAVASLYRRESVHESISSLRSDTYTDLVALAPIASGG